VHDASHLVGGQVDQDMRPTINGKVELFVDGGDGHGIGKGRGGFRGGIEAPAALSVGGTGQFILQRRGCRWWLLLVGDANGDHQE
jgi:hypothetical protein